MIEERVGDIFEQPDLTHIAHQCNLFHTMGSGIAKTIKEKFPEAYEADKRTKFADRQKLGTCSGLFTTKPAIINLYCQDGIGGQDRQTNYAAMGACFLLVEKELSLRASVEPVKLGIPYKIGCGLGNGNWDVVYALIEAAFKKAQFTTVICRKSGY